MRKPTLRETKVLFPKGSERKKNKKKNKEKVVLCPPTNSPELSQSSIPAPNSNKNRSLVCSHLFIVRCKLPRDTAQGRRAPGNSPRLDLPTTDASSNHGDPALLAVLEDAAIDLP